MALSPIWAFIAFLMWQMIARLPLPFAPEAFISEFLAVGFIVSAWIVVAIDRRFFPEEERSSFLPQRASWLLFALIAGAGFAILGSELGNIGESISDDPIPLKDAKALKTTPLTSMILGSFVYPICFIYVLTGVSQRALMRSLSPWVSICMIAVVGTFGAPASNWAQLAFVVGLPAWLFARSGSVALAILAYLPTTAHPFMEYVGLQPGILGFDVVETQGSISQPMWFNLLGAALIASGVGPLLSAFGEGQEDDAR